MACFQWNARMGQSESFSPSKSLTRAAENTSGLKLERAQTASQGELISTKEKKVEELRAAVGWPHLEGGGWQGQTAWQGSPTQLSQQQSSAKCTSTRSQAQDDDGFLHASLSVHASLKTAKRKTLTCFHWREGKLSSFLLNTKQRLSEGFKIWVWKVLWLDF